MPARRVGAGRDTKACRLAEWAAGVMEVGAAADAVGVGVAAGGVGGVGASRLRASVLKELLGSRLYCRASW